MTNRSLKKTFVFTHEEPGIKEIPFIDLKAGDIFYCEETDGDLCVEENGEFLNIAMQDALYDPACGPYVPVMFINTYCGIR